MNTSNIVAVVIGSLISGAFIAGIVALLKVRPEAGQITVTTAERSLVVQSGVLERLEGENKRMATRIDELERRAEQVEHLYERLESVEAENTVLRQENVTLRDETQVLRARVSELETEVRSFRGRS